MPTVEDYIEGWVGTYIAPPVSDTITERIAGAIPFDRDRGINSFVRGVLEDLDDGHKSIRQKCREELSDAVDETFAEAVAPYMADRIAGKDVFLVDGPEDTLPDNFLFVVGAAVWASIGAGGDLDDYIDLYERDGIEAVRATLPER